MSDTASHVVFWPTPFTRDFMVMKSMGEIVYPKPLRVVGSARSRNDFVLVPLVELTVPRGSAPRNIELWIPPSPGIFRFRAPSRESLTTTEVARQMAAYLATVGASVAYLHTDPRGERDNAHEAIDSFDVGSGRRLFHPLDRPSAMLSPEGLTWMILDAANFMMEPFVHADPDQAMARPPLLATLKRALAAGAEAAASAVEEYRAQIKRPAQC